MIYNLILTLRHLFYDKGWVKSTPTEIPSICVGNIAVGGTGKTPMTELMIRTLDEGDVESADAELYGFEGSLFQAPRRSIAVVSRGYKRRTKGFMQVDANGTAELYGDEPLQIKRKNPFVTVIVDEDRVRACDILAHPEKDKHISRPDIIIMDDAFQHRRVKATKSIALTTYDRPFFRDHLIPFGHLRDLRSRMETADMIVVTKCPSYLDEWTKSKWASSIGLSRYDVNKCTGINSKGKEQKLLFATVVYDKLQPVFPEGDPRYAHSKSVILFSGIADDTPLAKWLCESYKMMHHDRFADHHFFTSRDLEDIDRIAKLHITSLVVTTEKDAQRLRDSSAAATDPAKRLVVSDDLRRRTFYAPIRTQMLSAAEQNVFRDFLLGE